MSTRAITFDFGNSPCMWGFGGMIIYSTNNYANSYRIILTEFIILW